MDVGLTVMVLPVVLVVALLLACWIRLVSRGSVVFRQTRIGRGGEPFTIYKFRSMKWHAATDGHERYVRRMVRCNGPLAKLDLLGDRRLIRGGILIRMAGLDELPQLINVLRGEMSLVGPRPCLPSEYEFFAGGVTRRFEVVPGLTGLWQVRRGDGTTFEEMVAMDDEYVREGSAAMDWGILLRTPWVLLGQVQRGLAVSARRRRSGGLGGGVGWGGGDQDGVQREVPKG